MASYLGNNPDNIIKVRKGNYRYVATSGQTAFTGTDSNSLSMSINTADVEVFLNGVLLDQTDYTATISTVTLGAGATINDIVEVITNTDFQVASLYTKEEVDSKVATAITNLVGTAGAALDTLGELSDALADDANFASTVTTALGTKANSSDVTTLLAAKAPLASPTFTGNVVINSTSSFTLPAGTTAQRPASPVAGMTRFNTTLGYPEWYSSQYSAWIAYADSGPYTLEYLVVAGGGGGGGSEGTNGFGGGGGGGGAGGLIFGTTVANPTSTFNIVIGGGGSAGSNGYPSAATTGGNGGNTTAFSLTAIGGGGGSGEENSSPGSGGSGGGQGGDSGSGGVGSATAGQGSVGGGLDGRTGGGGGGRSEAGNTDGKAQGGDGYTWLNGTTYAGGGGGGGGSAYTVNSLGGDGGGGQGGATNGTAGSNQGWGGEANGSTNSGGGGGGKAAGRSDDGRGAGGSGIVIVRYQGTVRGSGGSISSSGGYTYHTFTSSGTYTA